MLTKFNRTLRCHLNPCFFARPRNIFPLNLGAFSFTLMMIESEGDGSHQKMSLQECFSLGKEDKTRCWLEKICCRITFQLASTTKPVTRRILLVVDVLQHKRVSWRDKNAAKSEKYYGGRGKTHTPIISRSSARKFLLSFKLKLFGAIILMMFIQMHSITLAHDIDNDIVSIDSINVGVFFL